MLNQDPIENLFSFICSSNNNIKRIRKMIKALTENFGILIGSIDGEEYFTFPTIDRLAQNDVESKLRDLKFGYRAKFIQQAAIYLKSRFKDSNEIYELRKSSYKEVFNELVKVPGIGNKVADCICLMSFHKFQAVPIDTHVLSIASNTYNFKEVKQNGKNKTITNKNYLEIGKKKSTS
jgi:N-glycosylase/DNA lyase